MSTPIVYSSTDPGAPIIYSNNPESFLTAIEICLTQGYSGKPSAGWTSHFRGAGSLALQMGGGSMRWLKLGPATTYQTNYTVFPVRGYDSMTNINTGTGKFPDNSLIPDANPIATRGCWLCGVPPDSASAIKQDWDIIADDRFFYFRFMKVGQPESAVANKQTEYYWFGDAVSEDPLDSFTTIRLVMKLASDNSSSEFNGVNAVGSYRFSSPFRSAPNTLSINNCHGMFVRNKYGTNDPGFVLWGGTINPMYFPTDYNSWSNFLADTDYTYTQQIPVLPNKTNNAIYLNEAIIMEYAAAEPSRYIRGKMPGLYYPLSSCPWKTRDTFDGAGQLLGKKFFCWYDNNRLVSNTVINSGPSVCISMNDWRS